MKKNHLLKTEAASIGNFILYLIDLFKSPYIGYNIDNSYWKRVLASDASEIYSDLKENMSNYSDEYGYIKIFVDGFKRL